MPFALEGSCRCGGITFTCESHTPQPYQRCYCSICRKTAGGGGYAINLGADTSSLEVRDPGSALRVFRAEIQQDDGSCRLSSAERHFCGHCATALWLYAPEYSDLVHPFASAVDTALPVPPTRVHMMLRFKPNWFTAHVRDGDAVFEGYPEQSLEDWHRERGLWVE